TLLVVRHAPLSFRSLFFALVSLFLFCSSHASLRLLHLSLHDALPIFSSSTRITPASLGGPWRVLPPTELSVWAVIQERSAILAEPISSVTASLSSSPVVGRFSAC